MQKTFEFALDETVWAAKQLVLLEFASMDIKDPLNFGFYMPPYSGRAGKFLDEERCLREYPMDRSEPFLEVIDVANFCTASRIETKIAQLGYGSIYCWLWCLEVHTNELLKTLAKAYGL